jgi:hypothetical protein
MNNKNSGIQIWVSLLLWLSISSCSTQRKYYSAGVVVYKILFYEPTLKKYVSVKTYGPDTKVWFKDSTAIVKTMGISINTDTNNIETRKVVVMYYTYIDLRSMLFYKYASFSDTAKIIQSYTEKQSDTIIWGVNWKFYQPKNIPYTEPLQNMGDTIIENKIYKRIKVINMPFSDTDKATTAIAYFDCSKKNTLFQIDIALGSKVGCPILKYYTLPSNKYPSSTAGEIDFVSDKLTPEELKVFDIWEKNVKKYPVKE